MELGPKSVGQRVCNAARPEWGVGQIQRVERVGGAFRVSIQFPMGHKILLVPPAKLVPPGAAAPPTREAGWLEHAAGESLDGKLRRLPEELEYFLGTAAQRLKALLEEYEWSMDSGVLDKWARRQAGVGQPLTLWSRDELLSAFGDYCLKRDALLRELVTRLMKTEGLDGARAAVLALPPEVRARVYEAAPRLQMGRL